MSEADDSGMTHVRDDPTTLWKVRRDSVEVECRVRLVPYGIEVDLVRAGAVALTRTFETDEEALAWAESKRAAREADGWHTVPISSPDPAARPSS